MRVKDETMVTAEDEEVAADEEQDEFSGTGCSCMWHAVAGQVLACSQLLLTLPGAWYAQGQ